MNACSDDSGEARRRGVFYPPRRTALRRGLGPGSVTLVDYLDGALRPRPPGADGSSAVGDPGPPRSRGVHAKEPAPICAIVDTNDPVLGRDVEAGGVVCALQRSPHSVVVRQPAGGGVRHPALVRVDRPDRVLRYRPHLDPLDAGAILLGRRRRPSRPSGARRRRPGRCCEDQRGEGLVCLCPR